MQNERYTKFNETEEIFEWVFYQFEYARNIVRKINDKIELIFELQESTQNINNRNRKFQQYEEFGLIYEIKDGRYIR